MAEPRARPGHWAGFGRYLGQIQPSERWLLLSDPEREYAGFAHTGIKWTPLSESLTEEELVALQSSAQAEANAEITRDGELEAR